MSGQADFSRRPGPARAEPQIAQRRSALDEAPPAKLLGETAVKLNAAPQIVAQRALAARLSAPVQRAEAPPAPNRTGLPNQLKAGIEALSGIAMDDVRVHRNSAAPAQLNAHAFAQGSDIHVAPGQDHHLPHEAWHVVQQKQGRVKATMQMKSGVPVNDDSALEREADSMGAKALSVPAGHANAAVALAGASPAQRRVIQRAKVNVRPATSGTLPGTISGITFGKRPASNSSKQGQHLTAYVAFQSMILSHTIDKDIGGAAIALRALLPKIRAFIDPKTTKKYLFTALDDVDADLVGVIATNIFDKKEAAKELGTAIDTILSIRNQVPGSALVTKNTGGHGEANPNGALMEMEKALLRTPGPPGDWDQNAVALQAGKAMWALMDSNPVSKNDPDKIAAALIKHMQQMMISFPKVFAWLSTKKAWYLRPLLMLNDDKLPLHGLKKSERQAVVDIMAHEGW